MTDGRAREQAQQRSWIADNARSAMLGVMDSMAARADRERQTVGSALFLLFVTTGAATATADRCVAFAAASTTARRMVRTNIGRQAETEDGTSGVSRGEKRAERMPTKRTLLDRALTNQTSNGCSR